MRNLKKVIALVAVFAMMVSTVAFAQTFTDVAEDHDYHEAIEMLSSLEILTGDDQDGDGKVDFRPNDTITRAEVAAIISRIQGINSAAQTATEFVDVPASHWASGYVAQAAGQGIVNGYGDGNFGPEDPVLYEQAVKMLVETLGYAPFVADNGGYPTGHLTAASRYGVIEGVVGASQGAQATRGMVAQMVYNAIDTPLMDRWTYGADAEYVIYNGKGDYDYVSLLSRDLGVKKFSGIVVENQVTSLTAANDIDTDEEAEIAVYFDDTDDYWNYDCNEIDTIYEADSNAGALLGMHVNMYVKERGRKGDYDVISVAATNKNKTVEFTLDQYAGVNGGYVEYYKNENDRTTTKVKLEAVQTDDKGAIYGTGFDVIYNNVATSAKLEDLCSDKLYSGKVTLVDNDSISGYDVAFVEIGATGVVDEVSASGKVAFKEVVKNAVQNEKVELVFDEDDNNQIIELTKDGVAIEYTELQEWDVLSILYNKAAEYYVAEVVESGKVEGSITGSTASDTSVDGKKYTINGSQYDVAKGVYTNGKLAVGASGVFYIDNYGKIVAYDKNGTTTASDKYAYVLAVSDVVPSDFGDSENIKMLLLDKDGSVYETQLSESVKIENNANYTKETSYKLSDLKGNLKNLANDLSNVLITYATDSQGYLKTITFAQDSEDEGTLWLADDATGVDKDVASYDEEDMELAFGSSKYDITEETVIFYINGVSGSVGLNSANRASETSSKVSTVATLATNDNLAAAVYDVDNDVPAVLVLWNTTGGISPATNVAVIDEVGTAYVDGEDVYSVSYFLNGEKLYATTSADLTNDTAVAAATQGDMWKFSVVDGVIVAAKEYFDATVATTLTNPLVSPYTLTYKAEGDRDVDYFFGPVVEYSSTNKRIRIAAWDAVKAEYDFKTTVNVKAQGANVYVYDPMLNKNKLEVGDASDVNFDKDLIETIGKANIDFTEKTSITDVEAGKTPLGMLDYAAAVAYDGDVLDVVIYKAYDFGRYSIDVPASK